VATQREWWSRRNRSCGRSPSSYYLRTRRAKTLVLDLLTQPERRKLKGAPPPYPPKAKKCQGRSKERASLLNPRPAARSAVCVRSSGLPPGSPSRATKILVSVPTDKVARPTDVAVGLSSRAVGILLLWGTSSDSSVVRSAVTAREKAGGQGCVPSPNLSRATGSVATLPTTAVLLSTVTVSARLVSRSRCTRGCSDVLPQPSPGRACSTSW
jgi:hypothetical protein